MGMSKDRLIWFKGGLVPAKNALVPVLSPTAQFGLNVFEGIRGYWNPDRHDIYLFRLDDHLDRLFESCRLIGLRCPYNKAEISTIVRETIRANEYRTDVAVRVTLFVDEEGTWSSSEPVRMFVAPIAKKRRDLAQRTGASACVSTWERISDRSMPPRAKVGANYINGRHAHLEAQRNGYDLPILLDRDGKVTEGAGSCLFMVRRGVLVTPSVTSSVLEGITRDTLMMLARARELPVVEREIDRTELLVAEELFVCGSAAEITPLTTIDRLPVGNGEVGTISMSLLEKYLMIASNAVADYGHWLSPVYQGS
jgi:branched-chain amino acid aminotransferase